MVGGRKTCRKCELRLKRLFIVRLWSTLKGMHSSFLGILLYPQNPSIGSEKNGRESSSSDIANKGNRLALYFPHIFPSLSLPPLIHLFNSLMNTYCLAAAVLDTWNTKMSMTLVPDLKELQSSRENKKTKINHYFLISAKTIQWALTMCQTLYRNTQESQTDKVPALLGLTF